MTAEDFRAWLESMGWSQREVARRLDLSRNTVAKYLEEGAPVAIGYACAALARGLAPWVRG